jgi:YHS domain-containing protein
MTPSTSRRALLAIGLFAAFAPRLAFAAEPAVNTLKTGFFGGRTDTAINGYDTVAYFNVGRPVKGDDRFVHEWMGAKWKFSSQANLDLFKANPERWAPQYGGYCAYGVAQDKLVKVEPDQFTVRDGKLYLNYDADVQAIWLKDTAGYVRAADSKFRSLLGK